jgi:hypothetical protein
MQPGELRYVVFSLELLASSVPSHGDLLVRVGWYRHACDSYYFLLDDGLMQGGDLLNGLARFLDQWTAQVDRLR